jgi:4-hydroxybenzoate polyprenyltransferase
MSTETSLESAFGDPTALTRPLCVDLDGTLITSDTLWESVVLLFRQRPLSITVLPFWLLGGRAGFKRRVSQSVRLNAATLPYRAALIDALKVCHEQGRPLVLATAADQDIADSVAKHLGFFQTVYASDGKSNLKAANKRDTLQAAYENGFDYVGDSSADAAIFEVATRGYLVGASSSATNAARGLKQVTVLSRRPSVAKALIKQLRVHQWAKNALVLLPVALAPTLPDLTTVGRGVLATITFSLCASGGYVFNDLLDMDADRAHATKRKRPLASGALPVLFGPPLFLALMVSAFALAIAFLPWAFVAMLAVYFVATLSYSLYLKRLLLLDVLVLAGLYTHRLLSGGLATGVHVTTWLLGFSMFFFTSLAFAKRYVELRAQPDDEQIKNRGYSRVDVQMVISMGTASGYIAALVFMLYVDAGAVRAGYREPSLLWLVLPVLLYWLGRIWLLAGRGQMQEDPVKFALRDRQSVLCGVAIALIAGLARFMPLWVSNMLH